MLKMGLVQKFSETTSWKYFSMKYSKVLIVGAGSYIASQILDHLDFGESEIFIVSRSILSPELLINYGQVNRLIIENFADESSFDSVQSFLDLNPGEALLVINFIGVFGTITNIDDIEITNFYSELQQNLTPFLVLSKIIALCNEGLFISFSGGGIGGDNLETASPSYLASKAALVIMIEGFDKAYGDRGARFTAVSPGAFPSRMQDLVANSDDDSVISSQRRSEAIRISNSRTDPGKLIALINYLIRNPDMAGGRVWSANFDELAGGKMVANFGKLRRIF